VLRLRDRESLEGADQVSKRKESETGLDSEHTLRLLPGEGQIMRELPLRWRAVMTVRYTSREVDQKSQMGSRLSFVGVDEDR
jgi:hypothetical protein